MRAYHMSSTLHHVGRILTGTGKPKVEPEVEKALERMRPETCLSRLKSVFSRENPDFCMLGLDRGYIYCILIRGDYQRHDARWIGLLQLAYLKPKHEKDHPKNVIVSKWPDWTEDFVATACANYWAGIANSDSPLWEFLSKEAEVDAQLSSIEIPVAETKGGWKLSDGA